jgi:hypothetical protein
LRLIDSSNLAGWLLAMSRRSQADAIQAPSSQGYDG